MKLPRKWTALLAFMAVFVVAFTGMVPGRAGATLELNPRVIGDNYGDPEEPGSGTRFSQSTGVNVASIDWVVRLMVAKQAQSHSRTSKSVVRLNNRGVSDRAR
jgi:hypothetical protein